MLLVMPELRVPPKFPLLSFCCTLPLLRVPLKFPLREPPLRSTVPALPRFVGPVTRVELLPWPLFER